VGNAPASVAVGDFNGDGKQDLAVANLFSATVSVMLRKSDNTGFETKVDYGAGDHPASVAVGDFNGDGKQDLAVANLNSATVSVLLRKSDNTGFETKVGYRIGYGVESQPAFVAVGDFNGDGRPDLAVANYNINNVSVLLRKSDNTGFETQVDYGVGNAPASVAVGDFNGDGRPDFAVANRFSDNVSVLLRNSANTGFEAKLDFGVGDDPRSVAVGDFNGDGRPDLATANLNSDNVSVLERVCCPVLTAQAPAVQVTNSTCGAGCVVGGGSIAAPSGTCPIGSTLQYSTDNGGVWSSTLPTYAQTGPAQTIKTRCLCNADPTKFSPESSVTTIPSTVPTLNVPTNGATIVACLALATPPTPPVVNGCNGSPITPSGPVVTNTPNSLTCEGTRTYTYTYSCGSNMATWSFVYTIEREPFTISTPNGAATVYNPALATPPTPPTVLSNCGETLMPSAPVITNAPNPLLCEGTRTYTYTYTDCEENTATWSFVYTIIDNIPPLITCPASLTVCESTMVTYTPPVGTDNCIGPVTTQIAGLPSRSVFPVGITTNTFKVTATNNQTATCSFTVTVNPLPTASISGTTQVCQNAPFPQITFTGGNGTAPYTFTYKINGGPDLTVTTSSGNSVSLAQTTAVASTFNYTLVSVKDASSTQCSQSQSGTAVITVNALPVVSTPQTALCTGLSMTLSPTSGGTWQSSNPAMASVNNAGLVNALSAGVVSFTFTQTSTGCSAATPNVTIKPTPTSALSASKYDVCPNTLVTLTPNCSIPTSSVNWNPVGPTVTPDAATIPYIYKARCVADGCVGNESSVEVRTHRILVDMKDLDVGPLPKAIVRSVKDNMEPTNLINAPAFPRRWTFIATGCDASESAVFKLSGPVNFNTIDNAATYAMFANDAGGFYSLDHPNYGNGGSFPNGTYSLTIDLRSQDGVGGPFPKNRVAVGSLLATRTLQFTVSSPQSIVGSRQGNDLFTVEGLGFAEVSPNPVSNTMRLKVSEAKGQNVSVSLVDASGRTMQQRSFVPDTNQHQEEFNVGDITNGMYFLRVNAENKNATLKVVKVE
jgi:hypothetical protein